MIKFSTDYFSSEDWKRVQKIGLYEYVKTPEQYKELVAYGMKVAYSLIDCSDEPVQSINQITKLHYHTFEYVHPWAGELRPIGKELMVGGMQCVGSRVVKKELDLLTEEMKREPFYGSKQYVSQTIAYYHSMFEGIHPFLDGNGRIGRMIMYHQIKLGLGANKEIITDRSKYMAHLKYAQTTGNLTHFGDYILQLSNKNKNNIKRR